MNIYNAIKIVFWGGDLFRCKSNLYSKESLKCVSRFCNLLYYNFNNNNNKEEDTKTFVDKRRWLHLSLTVNVRVCTLYDVKHEGTDTETFK